jgi:regulator of chromosome condensation
VLTRTGEVWCAGKAKHGRSGGAECATFTRIASIPRMTKISAGYWHSLAVDEHSQVWASGYNAHGQLGLGHSNNTSQFTATAVLACEIAAGCHYSLLVSISRELLACGSAKGSGLAADRNVFAPVPGLSGLELVAAGQVHAACVADGQLYTWGNNAWGQLGHSQKKNVQTPTLVPALQNIRIVSVSCSKGEKWASTHCVDNEHRVYSWGAGYKGKLGLDEHWSHEDPADRMQPEVIKEFYADSVEAGGIHTTGISNGRLFTWGCGSDGRIGHPEVEGHRYLYKEPLPRAIDAIPRVVMSSSSYYHNIILTE